MRTTALLPLLACLCISAASAQDRTEETVTTIDSTGKETTTRVVTVGKTEDITPRSNMITINPLKFFTFYNLSYYHAISPTMVVGGGLQTPVSWTGSEGIGVAAELRFHPSGKALRGFYVAPNVSFNSLSASDIIDASATAFSFGVLLGWQWFPGDEFAMGLGIGVDQYMLSTSSEGETGSFDSYSGTLPALRFDVGYAWK